MIKFIKFDLKTYDRSTRTELQYKQFMIYSFQIPQISSIAKILILYYFDIKTVVQC